MTWPLTAWLLLVAVYLAVLGDVRPGDLVLGAALAATVLAACRRFLAGTRPAGVGQRVARIHPLAVPRLAGATVLEIVRGTVDVAHVVLAPSPRARPGIVEIPLPEASAAGITTLALTTTLSPGSVIVDIDRTRGTIRVHVIDARDRERIRNRLLEFDRRWRGPAVE
jgi:multisubunit Na+/H+ antiporter MnhE subunit